MIRLALYQPDIPQNAGSILRTAACFGVGVDIIEPCGFTFAERHFRRAGMDYITLARFERFSSWQTFREARCGHRLVLLTTQGAVPYLDFTFGERDVLVFGRESAGVPADVHAVADARLYIPMAGGARSLNVAVAAGIVAAEALRQSGAFPGLESPREERGSDG